MRSKFKLEKALFSLLLSLVVFFSVLPTGSATTTATTAVNKKVYITNASYIQLIDANLIPSSNGATASFTFNFYNGDNTDIILNDYWARLKTTSGAKLSLSQTTQAAKKIAPNSSLQLTFYSQVGSNISLDKLIVSIVKFDFSVSGYERTVAQFAFPKGYTNEVKADGFKAIQINNNFVNMRVDQINVIKKDDYYSFNLTYVARNTSKFGVAIPQYNYYVQTSAGLFKLSLKKAEDANLLLEPTVLNAIRLSGSIPKNVDIKNWKLIITNNAGAEGNTVELPVVIFDIPFKIGNDTPVTNSDTAIFSSDYGTYELKLTQVQRLPWTTKDEVITEVSLTNKESVFLPIPNLKGQLIIDDNIKLESKLVVNTDDIGIAPGETKTAHYVGQIPFNYSWKKLMLELEETDEEGEITSVQLFNSKLASVKTIKVDETYTLDTLQSQLSAKITDVRTYKNDNSDLFAVYIDVTNNQNRRTKLSSWTGYFKTAEGDYFEAKAVKSMNQIKPSNKEQLIVFTELPGGYDKGGITLYLGEAFNEQGIITGNEVAEGYIRPILFELPTEKQADAKFNEIKVGPYTINMNYLNVIMDGSLLDMDLGVSVEKDRSYDGYTQNRIIMELEKETTGQIIFSSTIDLETNNSADLLLKVGENYKEIREDLSTMTVWDDYTLKLYEPLADHKRLLASKEIKWSPYINWMAETK